MGKQQNDYIDWKKNNKIAMRNFSENCDFHDVVKLLLVRMLRQKHRDAHKVPIYTEYDPENPQEDFPDIWMRLGKDIYVFEIQDKITLDWEKSICQKYESVNLVIVPLKKIKKAWEQLEDGDKIAKLKGILEEYVL
jgi:hypothetical protein